MACKVDYTRLKDHRGLLARGHSENVENILTQLREWYIEGIQDSCLLCLLLLQGNLQLHTGSRSCEFRL